MGKLRRGLDKTGSTDDRVGLMAKARLGKRKKAFSEAIILWWLVWVLLCPIWVTERSYSGWNGEGPLLR